MAPPIVSCDSRTVVEMELWDRREAQDRPARPEPMTMTSVVVGRGWDALELWKDMDRDVVEV